jgi:hypothetical protein
MGTIKREIFDIPAMDSSTGMPDYLRMPDCLGYPITART